MFYHKDCWRPRFHAARRFPDRAGVFRGPHLGAITMDAKGRTVVPEDFFDRLNPPGQSLGLDALCDRLVAEAKAEDEAFVAAITTHPEADLRKAAANLGTNDHCVSMRLAAEAELRRREA